MEPVESIMKWHSGTGKWQDSWVTLNSADGAPSLSYAKSRNAPPFGSLPLSELHKVIPADGSEVPGWKEEFQGRSLMVESGNTTHYLVTDNRREMLRWLRALTKLKTTQRKASLRAFLPVDAPPSSSASPNSTATPPSSAASRGNPRTPPPSSASVSPTPAPSEPSASTPSLPDNGAEGQAVIAEPDKASAAPTEEGLPSATAKSDAPTVHSKLQELAERRKLIAARASVATGASAQDKATEPAPIVSTSATDSGEATEKAEETVARKLKEMQLKAEQRRKQAEELVARRQAASEVLHRRKPPPGVVSDVAAVVVSTTPAGAGSEEGAKSANVDTNKETPQGKEFQEWRAKKKAQDEAQGNMKKMLVGELRSKISPRRPMEKKDDGAETDASNKPDHHPKIVDNNTNGAESEPKDEEREKEELKSEALEQQLDQKETLEVLLEEREMQNENDRKPEAVANDRQSEEIDRLKRLSRDKADADVEEAKRKEEEERERKRKADEEEEEEQKRREQEKAKEKEEEEKRKKEEEEARQEAERKERVKKEEEEEKERKRKADEERAREEEERAAQQRQREKDEEELEAKRSEQANREGEDVLLKQNLEEIEEKKKRMFERMKQRQQIKSKDQADVLKAPNEKIESDKNQSEGPTSAATEGNEGRGGNKRGSWLSAGIPSPAGSEGGDSKEMEPSRRASWLAKQPQPTQQTDNDGVAKKEAMKKMLETLSKQKAERNEERERLRKMLEERKKKKVEQYGHLLKDAGRSAAEGEVSTSKAVDNLSSRTNVDGRQKEEPVAEEDEERKKKQQQEELKRIKDDMRKIRSTIVLLDKESDNLNERIAQMHVQELQERRDRERQAREEQSHLERQMREQMMREHARDILLLRYVPLKSPREVREHEQHILEKTTQNAVFVNLSGILLGRGRSHGNWFAHELGRTDLCSPGDRIPEGESDDDRILRLKGGIVVRKSDSSSEWELLALPEKALMLFDVESSGLDPGPASPKEHNNQADDAEDEAMAISLADGQESRGDDDQPKKVFFNIADAAPEPEDLSPETRVLLAELQQAVNYIVEHFASANSEAHMAVLGDENHTRAVTRLVRGGLATVLAKILDVGFKSWKFFGTHYLWDYLEAYGQRNDSVRELAALGLRNAIKTLNSNVRMVENPHIKFRALICLGLNNKYLDDWVAQLVQHPLTQKWYNDESIMRDPKASGAVIKSLGRLKSFPFAMDINYEVRPTAVANANHRRTSASGDSSGRSIGDAQYQTPMSFVSTSTSSPGQAGKAMPSADTAAAAAAGEEARIRMQVFSGVTAARAAAAASAAAEVLSAGGGDNNISRQSGYSRRSAWGRPRINEAGLLNSERTKTEQKNESETEGKVKTGTVKEGGVTLWGEEEDDDKRASTVEPEELRREKRRGKERVRGSDEFYEEQVKIERVDLKVEIKEMESGERRSFFSSVLDLAKSMVEDD